MKNSLLIICLISVLFTHCSKKTEESETKMTIEKESFGKTEDGTEVHLYTLKNNNDMTVKITNYGGIVTSIVVPDKKGNTGDVVLGFDKLDDYLKEHPFFGALVGRYGNRIANGKFTLNDSTYTLAQNNGPNHLHGGVKGFDKRVWQAEEVKDSTGVGLKLTYLSKDGEEGYPGNLNCTVVYTLTDNNELKIRYYATTDKATTVNLTNHSYFNLAAGKAENALQHMVTIYADRYTPVDSTLIPTGDLAPVRGTPMDFTTPHAIGERIDSVTGGYDHNYVLNNDGKDLNLAAKVTEPVTGRVMEVYTTEPGVQFYTGNFLDGSLIGTGGTKYVQNYGFCLETQHFPDSPNRDNFPSTILNPGEEYKTTTVYKFSAE